MVAQVLTASAQSSHTLQHVESHIERLFQEIEVLVKDKKEAENVKKYTAEINKKISKIEAEIETRKLDIDHCQTMLNLPPGSWVRNGTTKPGKVIELVIAGRIPEVHVRWHGASITVPESPAKLTLVNPELVEYVWNGDRCPKLVRIIDGWECDEIDILNIRLAECIENKEDPDRRLKLAYCRKRIELIDREDLVNLERAVRQGLQVFYRVGEALAEIRDRKLYKQHGFTDFRDYLREYWNMGKSRAYQLIESAEVMTNLKTVHHGGQNSRSDPAPFYGALGSAPILPSSERITRELAKLPLEKQVEAWSKVVETAPDNNPTAAYTKAVVNQIIELDNKLEGGNKKLVEQFEIGQLVKLQLSSFDGASENLKSANHYYGQITALTENKCSLNVNVFGHKSFVVSPQDIKPVDSVRCCVEFSPKQFIALMYVYQTKNCLEDAIKREILEK